MQYNNTYQRAVAAYRFQLEREAAEATARAEEAKRSSDAQLEVFLGAHIQAKKRKNMRSLRPPATIVNYFVKLQAEKSGVGADAIMSPCRKHKVAQARFRVWKKLRDQYGYSLPGIGMAFSRDHTTILNGLRRLDELARRALVAEAA